MAVNDGRKRAGGDATSGDASTSGNTSGGSGTSSTAGTGIGPGDGQARIIDPIGDGDEANSGVSQINGRSGNVASDTGTGTGTGTGSSSSSSGARRGRTRNSSRDATRQAQSVQQDLDGVEQTPRKVKAGVDEAVKLPENSAALIGDLWAMLFWIAARVTSVPEVELTDPEQNALGEKTEALVKSLGKKKATAVMKQFGKFGPVVAFGGTLAGVAVPRAKLVNERRKSGILHQARPQQPTAQRPAASQPVTTAPSIVDVGGQGDAGDTTGRNAREPRTRSFTAADFEKASAGQSYEGI